MKISKWLPAWLFFWTFEPHEEPHEPLVEIVELLGRYQPTFSNLLGRFNSVTVPLLAACPSTLSLVAQLDEAIFSLLAARCPTISLFAMATPRED